MTPEELSDKWIKEMQEKGMTPDEMLSVIKKAKMKYELKLISNESKDNYYKENG